VEYPFHVYGSRVSQETIRLVLNESIIIKEKEGFYFVELGWWRERRRPDRKRRSEDP
jgi:hypothetical protein